MVPTATAAEGEKPNVHSTEPANTAKHPLADSTEGVTTPFPESGLQIQPQDSNLGWEKQSLVGCAPSVSGAC